MGATERRHPKGFIGDWAAQRHGIELEFIRISELAAALRHAGAAERLRERLIQDPDDCFLAGENFPSSAQARLQTVGDALDAVVGHFLDAAVRDRDRLIEASSARASQVVFRRGVRLSEIDRLIASVREQGSRASTSRAARRALAGASKLRHRAENALVVASLSMVAPIARRYAYAGIDMSDLEQEGALGLMRAAQKFDLRFRRPFPVYAKFWVVQAVQAAIQYKGRTIRLPPRMLEREREILKTMERIRVREGRIPSARRLARELDLEASEVDAALVRRQMPLSLDATVGPDGSALPLVDLLHGRMPSPYDSAEQAELCQRVEDVMAALPTKEADVLRKRCGIDGRDGMTLQQIGHQYGVTRERVRQIESHAINRLRRFPRRAELQDYDPEMR